MTTETESRRKIAEYVREHPQESYPAVANRLGVNVIEPVLTAIEHNVHRTRHKPPGPPYKKHLVWEVLSLRLATNASYAELAARYGVSRQYIQQLLRPSRGSANVVKARANGHCEGCRCPVQDGHGHVHHKIVAERRWLNTTPLRICFYFARPATPVSQSIGSVRTGIGGRLLSTFAGIPRKATAKLRGSSASGFPW